ncbi:MAG: hypothetical protein WC992_05755 [Acholeplasmataceae bacterium]|jgi:ABC-2 type transport system permease protein|nr:hypothetical protein [Acholeplasmataceae bacterium]
MFQRVKILTLLQLSNKSRLYTKESKRIYSHIAIRFAIILAITVLASLVLYVFKHILYIPVNEFLFIFLLMLTQGLNIVVATVGLINDLYHSKDNQILFALPAKNDEIFISKMLVYYIHEFIRNLFVLIPICIGFGVISNLNVGFYFSLLFILPVLPIVSVGIASLISIPFMLLINFLKRHHLISAFLILVLFGILFYLTYMTIEKIPTPIRIVQLYNRFIISLTLAMQQIASYGTIYTAIGKLLFGFKYVINLLIVILVIVGIVLVNYLISKPLYFKLMSSSQENTVKHNKKKKPMENSTLFFTFFKKEFTIARRSLNELLSNYALLLTLPFFMYILNYIYMGMNRSTMGNQIVLILNIMITLLIVTGSNTASATAITTEGYEFVLLKTAPYNTSRMAWAKITFNLIFTTLMIGMSFILFSRALPVFPKQDIWMLFIFILLVNSGHIFWSFQIDLLSPKLSDYAATGSISHNQNVSKSLTLGLWLSIIFGILGVFAFILMKSLGWSLMIGLALGFLLFRLFWFQTYLKAYFDDIEY